MRKHKLLSILVLLLGGGVAGSALADSPNCASNGTLLSWPATNPIWEMCWLDPSDSIGPRGATAQFWRSSIVSRRRSMSTRASPIMAPSESFATDSIR